MYVDLNHPFCCLKKFKARSLCLFCTALWVQLTTFASSFSASLWFFLLLCPFLWKKKKKREKWGKVLMKCLLWALALIVMAGFNIFSLESTVSKHRTKSRLHFHKHKRSVIFFYFPTHDWFNNHLKHPGSTKLGVLIGPLWLWHHIHLVNRWRSSNPRPFDREPSSLPTKNWVKETETYS